ncbi:MAG: GAF domain-containing protein, partial [Caulobacterales bacterium]|nr:GAF domain-containing protein [Caulobacterales bacterium]
MATTASIGPPHGGSPRHLMRQIREIMAGRADAQERLDQFVHVIAGNLVADVCSVYLRRQSGQLELCATEGLAQAAVHATRMRPGEGLVGQVALTARPLNLADAAAHPSFSFHPETGEEDVSSFLGVPILRGGRLLGVLTLQNRNARLYDEEEVETLQTAAMVLAEVVVDPALAGGAFAELELRPSRPERVIGRPVSDGVAVGVAVKRDPHVPPARMIADDPEAEAARVEAALARLRESVDALLDGRAERLGDQPREVLEAYRMFAHDQGWLDRLTEAARSGLTAEAAVERVRNEHRAQMMKARDPYFRDRLHDLEDLANRLLRHLSGEGDGGDLESSLPANAIVFARAMGPAELLEYDLQALSGLVLEEGSVTSHAAIIARALGLPVVGRVDGVLDRVEAGDVTIIDGAEGEVHLRPTADVLETYHARIAVDGELRASFEALRDRPAVTRDGRRLQLMMNAGLKVDLPQLERVGADGVGLFRTEFQFMISE